MAGQKGLRQHSAMTYGLGIPCWIILICIHVLETLWGSWLVPTERQLSKHGMHLFAVAWTAGLVHLSIRTVGERECPLELSLTKEEILVVVLARTHGATAEVVEQDAVFNLREPGEVEAEVVAPESVDAKHSVSRKNVRHDRGLVASHQISHGILVKQTTVKVSCQLFLEHLHHTTPQHCLSV